MMPIFLIASLRGDDFKVKADSPIHAWSILCEQEKDNGSLWKACDSTRNKSAVRNQGFSFYDKNDPSKGAYKQID